MPSCHSFRKFLNFPSHWPVVFFEIFSMLQYTIEVFLEKGNKLVQTLGQSICFEIRNIEVIILLFSYLFHDLEVFCVLKTLNVNKMHNRKDHHNKATWISVTRQTASKLKYLMLLSTLPLLFYLLLFLKLFCHTGLPQSLALASLVGFGVQCCLQRCVTTHACYHLLSQLPMSKKRNT